MKYFMGISALQTKSAAALIDETGNIICVSEEERRTDMLNDKSWPQESISWCMRRAQALGYKIEESDVQYAYYEKPFSKLCRRVYYNPKKIWPFFKDAILPYQKLISFRTDKLQLLTY